MRSPPKLSVSPLGVVAFEGDEVVAKAALPKDPKRVASLLRRAEREVIPQEEEVLRRLRELGYEKVLASKPEKYSPSLELRFERCEEPSLLEVAKLLGVGKAEAERISKEVAEELVRLELREKDPNALVVNAVSLLEEVEGAINTLAKGLREFYSLHLPELDKSLQNHRTYARAIVGEDEEAKKLVEELEERTMGFEFSKADRKIAKELAKVLLELYKLRDKLKAYLSSTLTEFAPNLSALVGPILAAKLISLAGSLEKLAKLPASTIQLLGAEPSFFRYLRTGRGLPKHGVILQVPEIRTAPREVRGKLARTLASKLALAARADHFKGKFIGEELRKDFLRRVQELK